MNRIRTLAITLLLASACRPCHVARTTRDEGATRPAHAPAASAARAFEESILPLVAPLTPGSMVVEGVRFTGAVRQDRSVSFGLVTEGGTLKGSVEVALSDDAGREVVVRTIVPDFPRDPELSARLAQAAASMADRVRAGVDPARLAAALEPVAHVPDPPPSPAEGVRLLQPAIDVRDAARALLGGGWWVAAIAGLALAAFAAASRRGRPWTWAAAVVASGGLLAGGLVLSPVDYHSAVAGAREELLVTVVLAVAACVTAVAAVRAAVARVRDGGRPADRSLLVDTVAVAAASLAVRYLLTRHNLVEDGASYFFRMLRYDTPFGGVGVLVRALLPRALEGFIWNSVEVTTFLSALAPPALVLAARSLGLNRPAAFLAGLSLACWPLHAALFSTEFEQGTIVTIAIAATALLALAARSDRPGAYAAGASWAAFVVWGRPETIVVLAPLAWVAWPAFARSWRRPAVLASTAWLAVVAAARVASVLRFEGTGWSVLEPSSPSLGTIVSIGGAGVPWWIWLPFLPGLALLRGRARVACIAGIGAGIVPMAVRSLGDSSWFEIFRYGSLFAPWVLLASASGLAASADLAVATARRIAPRAVTATGPATLVVATVLVAGTPLLHRAYLGREYDVTSTDALFRVTLPLVDPACGLVVPSDDRDPGLDALDLYRAVLAEETDRGRATLPRDRVVGAQAFAAGARGSSGLPPVPGGDPAAPCWLFLRTGDCQMPTSLVGVPAGGVGWCAAIERDFVLEPVRTGTADFEWHRRVVLAAPGGPPEVVDSLPVGLWRIARPKP
jgi:hypothetical protein